MNNQEYYVICLRHMFNNSFCFEFWIGHSGYTYNVNKAWKVTKESEPSFFDGTHHELMVPVELIDKIKESYQMNMDGWEDCFIVRNLPETRDLLNINIKCLEKGNRNTSGSQWFRKFDPKLIKI